MAQHDFIAQYAAALAAGGETGQVIARGIWSGLEIDLIDALVEIAEALVAG
jgi:hypothetical protein